MFGLNKLQQDIDKLKETAITEEKLKHRVSLIVNTISEINESAVTKNSHIQNLVETTVNNIVSTRLRAIIDTAMDSEFSKRQLKLSEEIRKALTDDITRYKESVQEYKKDLTDKINVDLGHHITHCPGKENAIVKQELIDRINIEIKELEKNINELISSVESKVYSYIRESQKDMKEEYTLFIKDKIKEWLKEMDIKASDDKDSISENTPIKISFVHLITIIGFVLGSAGNVYYTFWNVDLAAKNIAEIQQKLEDMNKKSTVMNVDNRINNLKLEIDSLENFRLKVENSQIIAKVERAEEKLKEVNTKAEDAQAIATGNSTVIQSIRTDIKNLKRTK